MADNKMFNGAKNDVKEIKNAYDNSKKAVKGAKKAAKVAKGTAKTAAKATTASIKYIKIAISTLSSSVSLLPIILAVCFLVILPMTIFSTVFNTDESVSDTTSLSAEQQALEDVIARVESNLFWDDVRNFFATGKSGNNLENFKSEIAKYKEPDMQGYSDVSNVLVTVVSQIFQDGAKDALDASKSYLSNSVIADVLRQRVADDKSVPIEQVTYTVSNSLTNGEKYLEETILLIAANGASRMGNQAVDGSIKDIADAAFRFAGGQKTVTQKPDLSYILANTGWDVVQQNSTTGPRDVKEFSHYNYIQDNNGAYKVEITGGTITYTLISANETVADSDRFRQEAVEVTKQFYDITVMYFVTFKPTYKDFVYTSTGIAGNAELIDIASGQDIEMRKLYMDTQYVNIAGQKGLPLAPFTYSLTSQFGEKRIINGALDTHAGLDMASPEGYPIFAVADGKVTTAETDRNATTYGYYVIIRHSSGGNNLIETRYAHMVSTPLVAVGDDVNIGDIIGYVGTTGQSTGNHLHFEYRVNMQPQDPLLYFPDIKTNAN